MHNVSLLVSIIKGVLLKCEFGDVFINVWFLEMESQYRQWSLLKRNKFTLCRKCGRRDITSGGVVATPSPNTPAMPRSKRRSVADMGHDDDDIQCNKRFRNTSWLVRQFKYHVMFVELDFPWAKKFAVSYYSLVQHPRKGKCRVPVAWEFSCTG